ncbi:thiamine biosynthesis protein MoeB [Heyndrickxia shackletonii]|uniref:Thiamine biosynthesis protein MoeB n=1 Tax=Heyndrickxia shackletonii TaxID=157838 RepID=A0A0Q3TC47_9BACI|nr:ThiF family adenylyltransferase [Heyndrickxia shackletonii]KQL51161.1 thiamine biosynthesis protein MoeB [Heyndrickxia shackletonii]MBB2479087.1 ThiF family adenylyltransferase [Bacillus sp. APMAM]NEZ00558.1 thiamine biosynthesis protein MoeB [Heyndrickxia shackletonii]RTZ57231.1 thiamine biosynthesis protein MoeB [Bacillus sp. SAJ1]
MNRYSRQTLFSPIGIDGQEKIRKKHVLIVGMGALGSAIAETLTRAGVGKLTIIDRDYVEESNLQRQLLYSERDAQERVPKAEAAKKRLNEINQDVDVGSIVGEADAQLLESVAPDMDLIMDGTDNFETRFIMNDIAHKFRIPWIFGSCVGSFGSAFTIIPGETPCLQCLMKKLPMNGQTCDTVGIIAPTVQMVTAYQTAEALKILSENNNALRNTYVTFDLWQNQTLSIKADATKNPDCYTCGHHPTYPNLHYEVATKTAVLCGRNTVQIRPSGCSNISIEGLTIQWRKAGYEVSGNPYLVSVLKGDYRMVLFKDGRALIHGTNDVAMAKKVYHSLIG